jgi:hypothetical protein
MPGGTRRLPGTGSAARRAGVVSCWLCGIRLHSSKMMPDGGDWCDDTRWYCRDAEACTGRWTTSRRVLSADGEESQERAPDTGPRVASHLDPPAPGIGEVARAARG